MYTLPAGEFLERKKNNFLKIGLSWKILKINIPVDSASTVSFIQQNVLHEDTQNLKITVSRNG